MKRNQSREDKKIELFTQARNPVMYTILKNDNLEQHTIPIDENTLQFNKKELNTHYFISLYLNESENSFSNEFKQNLIHFYVFFTLVLVIVVTTAGAYYSKNEISIQELRFHIMSSILMLTIGYLFLLLLIRKHFFFYHNRQLFLILGLVFCSYSALAHKNVLFKILKVPEPECVMPFSLYTASFIYFFRGVTFDCHHYTIILSSFSSIFFLIIQISVSGSIKGEKFSEYFSLTLILFLNCIESYKVSTRSLQLFYRNYQEKKNNSYLKEKNRKSSAELISSSELVIEKCDNVITEIQNAKKIIIFKDIRDRLRVAIKNLNSIKKYLGHLGVNDEIISISDSANIDEEDKQFLAENFLSITGLAKDYNKNRHLTLKDLLSKKERVSLSLNALASGADTLDSVGNDWNLNMFELVNRLKNPLGLIAKHFFYKWEIGALLRVDRDVFFRFFENVEIVKNI